MSQWFAPTKIVLTFEMEGKGRFSEDDIEKLVVRNEAGHISLRLPNKYILISNHQVSHTLFTALFDDQQP
jgi:hypothetical protein